MWQKMDSMFLFRFYLSYVIDDYYFCVLRLDLFFPFLKGLQFPTVESLEIVTVAIPFV